MTHLEPLTADHRLEVEHIVRHMRDIDRRENFAMAWDETPASFAATTMMDTRFTWIAYWGEEPVAIVGARPVAPKVWLVFAYGTDRFGHVGLLLTRHIKRVMIPALVNAGARLALAWVLADYTEARRWLRSVGFSEQCEIPSGKNGERFVLMTREP